LIVMPDADARENTSRLFERVGYATAGVATGGEALAAADERRPSLILLELELDDMTGYEVCFELRSRAGEDLPVILISSERTTSADRVAGLMIGADDYLTAPFDPDELLVRARRLLSRMSGRSTPPDTPLTTRETQVLQLLADGQSQDAIAEKLFISAKTVGTHIQRILTKLGVHSRTEAVALAYRQALITTDGRDPSGAR
jgi:DNA-binding NarL/FixJ family response regulator